MPLSPDEMEMAPTEFDGKSRSFLSWFGSQPGATFHPDIKIADLRRSNAGRGIEKSDQFTVATADIPEDTVLFTIPRDAIINTLTSELPQKIPHIFTVSTTALEDTDNEADEDNTVDGPDSWISLILVMIYEYLQGDKSKWKLYFDVLPETFDTPMFWSGTELMELQASAVTSKIGRDEADNMFRAKILPVIEEYATIFYPDGSERLSEPQLIALAHRMGSTIMAYAFDLENEEEDLDGENDDEWVEDKEGRLMMGMVPMADILNADAQFNAHVNHDDENLTVTTLKPIAAGTELLNYYGPLSNGELLRRYGYVTPTHGRYDVVEITWELVVSVLRDHLKLSDVIWGQAVNEIDDEEIEDTFVIDRDLDVPDSRGDVHGDVKLRHLPADLEEQIMTFLKAVRKASPDSIPDKRKRDAISAAVILRALELRLAEYSTSEAYDLDLIRERKVAGRQLMAVMVRMGEKKLLQEAINLAAERVNSETTNGIGDTGLPTAKRQRHM